MVASDAVSALREVAGVLDIHDLHIWTLGAESHALSCHALIGDMPPSESEAILQAMNRVLLRRFHIHHTTIQFEHLECDIAHGCIMPVPMEQAHSSEPHRPHNH